MKKIICFLSVAVLFCIFSFTVLADSCIVLTWEEQSFTDVTYNVEDIVGLNENSSAIGVVLCGPWPTPDVD